MAREALQGLRFGKEGVGIEGRSLSGKEGGSGGCESFGREGGAGSRDLCALELLKSSDRRHKVILRRLGADQIVQDELLQSRDSLMTTAIALVESTIDS